MRCLLSTASLAAALVFALPAGAQTAPVSTAPPPAGNGADNAGVVRPAPEGLYQALGEKAGIDKLTDDLVTRAVADPVIGHLFKDTKLPAFKTSLALQICLIAGGPCVYEGDNMKAAHADFVITKTDFNRLVELLQSAMDQQGVPFRQQNQLLALLAPMHRDVITKR